MDTASLTNALGSTSIVAWFALLVVVFAVFVGLGIYEGLRQPRADDDASNRSRSAPKRGPPSHCKE